ncbi:MAG TPA: SMC-Scp complex subunit ScpB [Agriterribacter sp.]|nr:SMC-Scp complex subunit ScpB [Agriterribacter sp.]
MEDRATLDQVESAIEGIREKYATEFYPFEVRQSGGGWQFLTKGDFHKTIAQLNGDKFLKRLSAAAMEALAIIAYKQPITKGEIESIRGVNCDYVIQKLLEKELVVITGRDEALPGKPLIYATSRSFMDYFGINSAEDLPRIKEILADQVVEPTLVNARHFEVEAESNLVVAENGELVQHTTLTIEGETEAEVVRDKPTAGEAGDVADEEAATDDTVTAGPGTTEDGTDSNLDTDTRTGEEENDDDGTDRDT